MEIAHCPEFLLDPACLYFLWKRAQRSFGGVASDQRFIRRTPFVFIGNNEYETASFRMGGRKGLDGGRLSIYTAPVRGRFELFKLFVKAFLGRINEQDNFDTLSATRTSVMSESHFRRSACLARTSLVALSSSCR